MEFGICDLELTITLAFEAKLKTMKKLLFAAHVLVALALVSCNNKTEQKAEEKTDAAPMTAEPQKINVKLADLASGKDYVCGMGLEEGSIADTASYEAKLYGFCSSECKAEFVKNPSSYLAEVKK